MQKTHKLTKGVGIENPPRYQAWLFMILCFLDYDPLDPLMCLFFILLDPQFSATVEQETRINVKVIVTN